MSLTAVDELVFFIISKMFPTILSVPALEVRTETEGYLKSVVFSPVDPFLVAVAGFGGTRLMDIRNQLADCRLVPVSIYLRIKLA